MSEERPLVLVVAGFDPTGGAGVLRDLATITQIGLTCLPVVAAVTAQDESHFHGFEAMSPGLVVAQARLVLGGLRPGAVKIGMLGSLSNIEAVGEMIRNLKAKDDEIQRRLYVVADPLLLASTGGGLTDDLDLSAWRRILLPVTDVATPNVPEAEVLSGRPIHDRADMAAAAQSIGEPSGTAVVVKGGHLFGTHVEDVLWEPGGKVTVFKRRRLTGGVHGSGCTFSSTLAARLALGSDVSEAVWMAGNAVVARIRSVAQTGM